MCAGKRSPPKAQAPKPWLIIARDEDLKTIHSVNSFTTTPPASHAIPVDIISRQSADKLFALSSTSVSQLEQATAAKTPGNNRLFTGEISLATDVIREEVPAYNVVGVLEGSDPVLKNEYIVIGAHYDHLGRGGEGSGSLAPRSGEIHHGADDNASGTAGMIELARIFSAQRPKLKRTLVFIGFGGEEEGLLGSNYYVNHPLVPLDNTVAMINMDMIGRMKDRKLSIGGVGTATEWRELIRQANTAQSMTVAANSGSPRRKVYRLSFQPTADRS